MHIVVLHYQLPMSHSWHSYWLSYSPTNRKMFIRWSVHFKTDEECIVAPATRVKQPVQIGVYSWVYSLHNWLDWIELKFVHLRTKTYEYTTDYFICKQIIVSKYIKWWLKEWFTNGCVSVTHNGSIGHPFMASRHSLSQGSFQRSYDLL